jgi:signal transduction histidine kinase
MDAGSIISALDGLILEHTGSGHFVTREPLPAWCRALPRLVESADFELEEVFPFLGSFLDEAARVWHGEPASTSSGLWTQRGAHDEELHLEASPIRVGPSELLIVSRNDRHFREQQLVLQRARELRLAQAALLREIEQKDVLLHRIVHDLAAPVQTVAKMLSLFETRPERSREWFERAKQAIDRQRQLIGEVLEVFSAEHGVFGSDAPTADLSEVVARVLKELEPLARRRCVRIVGASIRRTKVVAEHRRFVRVMTNLLDNAIRNSPRGAEVELDLRSEGGWILLSIDDLGPPVPLSELPRLFEKFARSGERVSGTPLGLYFCRITAERWGGGIGYEDRAPGARFWIRLRTART